MMDLGWGELVVIMAVAVLVIGPEELPVVMRTLGRVMRRFQYIKYAISRQFDDLMEGADIDAIRKSVNFEAHETDEAGEDVAYIEEDKKAVKEAADDRA